MMRIYIDVLKLIEREDLYGRERPDPIRLSIVVSGTHY